MKTCIAAMTAIMAMTASASAARPQRAVTLTGKAMTEVLKQCSRVAPIKGEAWFKPTAAQIATLDRLAAAKLNGHGGITKVGGAAELKRRYAVEVVGIVRGGRRFVYGNYYPLSMQEGMKDAPVPMVVCDGGASFFGIEMDAARGVVTQFDTNGRA